MDIQKISSNKIIIIYVTLPHKNNMNSIWFIQGSTQENSEGAVSLETIYLISIFSCLWTLFRFSRIFLKWTLNKNWQVLILFGLHWMNFFLNRLVVSNNISGAVSRISSGIALFIRISSFQLSPNHHSFRSCEFVGRAGLKELKSGWFFDLLKTGFIIYLLTTSTILSPKFGTEIVKICKETHPY